MSYHRFPNIQDLLHSDMMEKIDKNFQSLDECLKKCNCCSALKIKDGECIFGSRCREKCVVYQVKYIPMGKIYIGKTSLFLKERFNYCFNDVKSLANFPFSQSQDMVLSLTLLKHLAENVNVENADVMPIRASNVRKIYNLARGSNFLF